MRNLSEMKLKQNVISQLQIIDEFLLSFTYSQDMFRGNNIIKCNRLQLLSIVQKCSITDKHIMSKYITFFSNFMRHDILCSEWMNMKYLFLDVRLKKTIQLEANHKSNYFFFFHLRTLLIAFISSFDGEVISIQ